MDALHQKPGLDPVFRNNILNNLIIKNLKELANNSENPEVLREIYRLAVNFEKKVYTRATNKNDYLDIIKWKLSSARADAPPAHTGGNQLINKVIQKQADVPQLLQKPLSAPLPTMLPIFLSVQPYSNQSLQDHQYGHQSVIPSVQQHRSVIPSVQQHQSVIPSVQQRPPMNDNRSMSIKESYERPSQLSSPLVISQTQRDHIQDARLQRTHMPSTSYQCRTLVGEDKHSPQSPMISTAPSPVIGSFPDAVNINDPDWKLLIDQYQRARLRFLPDLMKLSQRAAAEEKCYKEKNEKLKAAKCVRILIHFFTTSVSELMRSFPKEQFSQLLNKAINGCRSTLKKCYAICAARNQRPQPSDGHSPLNNEPILPTVNTALIRNFMISGPSAKNSSFGRDVHATEQVDKSLLHRDPEGTADQYAHLNVKKDPRLSQSSSEKQPQESLQSLKPRKLPDDPMNSMVPSMSAKQPKRVSMKNVKTDEKQPRKSLQSRKLQKLPDDLMNSMFRSMSPKPPKRVSTKTAQIKNTSSVLKSSAMSQPKESVLDHLPLIPMTPSSTPKEIENPSKNPSECLNQVSQPKASVSDHSPSTPMTPSSAPKEIGNPIKQPSECLNQVSSAPKEIENPSKQPIERLIQVIQSMSKKALRSSSYGIASAMMAVDELPNYSNLSHRNMKRNIDSVGGYVSTLDNCGSCVKRSRIELDHSLMDEIREINQRLLQTVVEVDSHSGSDSHKETIIKCTYKPVFFNENLKRHLASMSSLTTLSIKFIVPSCYPISPPKIFDQVPVECCPENVHLMEKARSRFDCRVQSLVSLREMAQAWDDIAHSVFSDMVISLGGETFSSKYGTWECVPVA